MGFFKFMINKQLNSKFNNIGRNSCNNDRNDKKLKNINKKIMNLGIIKFILKNK